MVNSSLYALFALVVLVSFSQAKLLSKSYSEESTSPLERRRLDCGPEEAAPIFESLFNNVCKNFAIHARTAITFSGESTTIHFGDVAIFPGSAITGAYEIENGKVESETMGFALAVMGAHSTAFAVRDNGQAMAVEMGGKTFTPGTYRSGTINIAAGTVVTLDGLNEPNPMFLFQAGTTLITAANTHFILKNGAKAKNVLWALGTAATLGANSVLEGSILAGTAITFGTKSELRGCALAQTAVTFASAGSIEGMHELDTTIPQASGQVSSFDSISHSVCQDFAVHARTSINFNGAPSNIQAGNMGVSPGTSITGAYEMSDGEVDSESGVFAASVTAAHASAMAVRIEAQSMENELGGKTFTPGTYRSASGIIFTDGTVVTLDGLNQIDPVFVFQVGTTLITGTDTHFILKNGATAENVLWAIGSAVTLGVNSVLEGSILAGTAITFLPESELRGCALAQSAVIFTSAGSVVKPHYSEPEDTAVAGSVICATESLSHSVCQNFAVHARTSVDFDGFTTIHGGDVGVSPGNSITGNYVIGNGAAVRYESSAAFAESVMAAHTAAIAVRADGEYTDMAVEIGGITFTPGTHRSDSAITLAFGAVVTLDGLNQTDPVFLFQAATTLVTAKDTHFIMKNGATAENILWALGASATLGANSVLEGSILAGTSITFGTKSKLHGCALAQTAVIFDRPGYVGEGTHGLTTTRHLRG